MSNSIPYEGENFNVQAVIKRSLPEFIEQYKNRLFLKFDEPSRIYMLTDVYSLALEAAGGKADIFGQSSPGDFDPADGPEQTTGAIIEQTVKTESDGDNSGDAQALSGAGPGKGSRGNNGANRGRTRNPSKGTTPKRKGQGG